MESEVVERFCRYVKVETTSSFTCEDTPSTRSQFNLARLLVDELRGFGADDVRLDERTCVVTAAIRRAGVVASEGRGIALLAHLDTSPDASGLDVKPLFHTVETGKAIQLPGGATIQAEDLEPFAGQRIISSDGSTLLGADDKAGVAILMTAAKRIIEDKSIPIPGEVLFMFTPDEEVGRGTEGVDVEALKKRVAVAYTFDGDMVGTIEAENFNAFGAKITVEGFNVHPGYSFGKMVNAAQIVSDFNARLPANARPETTKDRKGFIHLKAIGGSVEKATASFILRDFEDPGMDALMAAMRAVADQLRAENPKAKITLEFEPQYRNMKSMLKPEAVEAAVEAVAACGLKPELRPIRGGTDGARLTCLGLSCPNIFAGGMLFHSRSEFVPIPALEKGVETAIALIRNWAQRLK